MRIKIYSGVGQVYIRIDYLNSSLWLPSRTNSMMFVFLSNHILSRFVRLIKNVLEQHTLHIVVEGSVFPDCVDPQSLQQVGPKSERGWFPNSCCCHICVIQLNIFDCKDNTFYLYSNTFFHLFVYTAEPLLCNVIKVMADFFGHRVECYAFGTSDVTFPFVVGPRAEY